MAFHPREFAMDPEVLDRIRDDQNDRDPLTILMELEDEWIRDRNMWEIRNFNEPENIK